MFGTLSRWLTRAWSRLRSKRDRKLVRRVHREVLGRDPDPGSWELWSAHRARRGLSADELREALRTLELTRSKAFCAAPWIGSFINVEGVAPVLRL